MNNNIGIAAKRAGEVCIKRCVQSVVAILRDIKHAGAEILRTMHGLRGQNLKDLANVGIGDRIEAVLNGGS